MIKGLFRRVGSLDHGFAPKGHCVRSTTFIVRSMLCNLFIPLLSCFDCIVLLFYHI